MSSFLGYLNTFKTFTYKLKFFMCVLMHTLEWCTLFTLIGASQVEWLVATIVVIITRLYLYAL